MSTREPRETRNKRIALELLAIADTAAHHYPPTAHALNALRDRWHHRGITWLTPPTTSYDLDAWLPATDIAPLADVQPSTIRAWHYRGHITSEPAPDGTPLYSVREVAAHQARRTRNA